ncbi:MAG: hypothetical protein QOK16_2353 [Solirubrobacteraceae bacterium]|jgi:plastocyanin|nr:hypothetical protein [Solirubrobacteraceae bacterium]MEA2182904.1 hypothetical protein [Solirubrobacteraceae bacterium]MEA2187342.1 hypothetical protein [Solirubrobacteraceae bacterium]
MRKLPACIVGLVVAAAFAVPALAATRSVKVGDNYYVRDRVKPIVTVKRNDIVIWRFVGRSAHTVTVRTGPQKFSSPARTSGSFQRKLTKAGTYQIYCQIHGARDQSMVLRVR